jgi:parallel beta-helix repeat protein
MIKLRTKIEAAVAIFLLMIISAVGVASVTRTISDNTDNSDTFIKNSKGNYWDVTESNLQAAINDLTNGGTVWIPTGTLTITNTLTITHDGINLMGFGNSTILRLGNAQNKDILRIGLYDSTGANNLIISNIMFDMNNANNDGISDNNRNAIDIRGYSRDVTIRDCYFKDGISAFIIGGRYTSYITVDSCHFDGMEVLAGYYPGAIWFEGDYCIASNNMIRDTYACGIIFESGTAGSVAQFNTAYGNEITGNIAYGLYMEGSGRSNNCSFLNNFIHNINSTAYVGVGSMYVTGILLMDNSSAIGNRIQDVWNIGIQSVGNVVISDNIIDKIRSTSYGYGIQLSSTGNAIIKGNIISNIADQEGIYGTTSGRAIVTDNTIYNCGDDGIRAGPYWVISNNKIWDCDYGIDLVNGASSCTISGNIVNDCTKGIYIYNNADVTVTGNRVYSCTDGIEEAGTTDWTICVGNNCRGCTDGVDVDATNSINDNNLE